MKEIIIDSKETVFSSFVRTALYYETDQMGIIHHSNYIRWFEEARLHYMKELGLPYDELERMGIIIPVTLVMGIGFFMMMRANVLVPSIILAIVWVCHIIYFVFGVKTIRKGKIEKTREKIFAKGFYKDNGQ